jgi:hypothetical protein
MSLQLDYLVMVAGMAGAKTLPFILFLAQLVTFGGLTSGQRNSMESTRQTNGSGLGAQNKNLSRTA